jgi:hypothetical protein
MDRIKVYVYSTAVSTLEFVDLEGARHACAHAGSSAFQGLKYYPGTMDNRYLSEEERKAIDLVAQFSKENGLEFEIVDLANCGLMTKTKLFFKGIRNVPTITYRGKRIEGLPNEENLKALLQE